MNATLLLCLFLVLCCFVPETVNARRSSSRSSRNRQCLAGLSQVHAMFRRSSGKSCSDLVRSMKRVVGTLTTSRCGGKKPIQIMNELRSIYGDFTEMSCMRDSSALAITGCAAKCATCFAPLFRGRRYSCGTSGSKIDTALECLDDAKSGCKHMGKLKSMLRKAKPDMC